MEYDLSKIKYRLSPTFNGQHISIDIKLSDDEYFENLSTFQTKLRSIYDISTYISSYSKNEEDARKSISAIINVLQQINEGKITKNELVSMEPEEGTLEEFLVIHHC